MNPNNFAKAAGRPPADTVRRLMGDDPRVRSFDSMLSELVLITAEAVGVAVDHVTMRYTPEFGWDCWISMPPAPRRRHRVDISAQCYEDGPASPTTACDSAIEQALFSRDNGFCGEGDAPQEEGPEESHDEEVDRRSRECREAKAEAELHDANEGPHGRNV